MGLTKTKALMVVSSLLFLLGCSESGPQVAEQIRTQLQQNNFESINLGATVEGDWDEVCFIEPYSTPEDIESVVGFPWTGQTNIESDDSVVLLIFTKDQQAVLSTDYERYEGFDVNGCYGKSDSTFVKSAASTDDWLFLEHQPNP